MQMSQVVQTFRLRLLDERSNMYTDLCWLQDCENQAAQEDVEVIKLLMEIARRRMKVVTEKSAYIPDTPSLCPLATVKA